MADVRPSQMNMEEVRTSLRNQPWKNASGDIIWHWARINLHQLINSQWFEISMACVVISNFALIIYETDLSAKCYPDYDGNLSDCPQYESKSAPWLAPISTVYLLCYTIEVLIRIYVERNTFVQSWWNALDLGIVATGFAGLLADGQINVAFLRFLRIVRLARLVRVFSAVRELYFLLSSMFSATKTIFWGSILLLCTMLVWSIILVEFVHPICSSPSIEFERCVRCPTAFKSVMSSVLFLFQLIAAGDGWGDIRPLMEARWWMPWLFLTAYITIALGSINLILARMVEGVSEERQRDSEENLIRKEKKQLEQRNSLRRLCLQMDKDNSGTLDLYELLDLYDNDSDFRRTLSFLDIKREELVAEFNALVLPGSNDVDYNEFCEQLHTSRSRDPRTMITLLSQSVKELKADLCTIPGYGQNRQSSMVDMGTSSSVNLDNRFKDQETLLYAISEKVEQISKFPEAQSIEPSWENSVPVKKQHQPIQSLEAMLEDIRDLGGCAQQLASLKGSIVKRLEDQVVTLTRQAGVLASIGVSVQSGQNLPPDGLRGFTDAQQATIGERLGKLQENMHQQLSGLLRDVDHKLEDGAAMLARNSELLSSLGRELGFHTQWEQAVRQRPGGSS